MSPADLSARDISALWALHTTAAALGWQGSSRNANSADSTSARALFEHEEAETLEWLDDVAFLNKRGWAHKLNYAIAAPLLTDLQDSLARMARALSSVNTKHAHAGPVLRLLFGHGETLAPLLCHLGLFGSPECSRAAHMLTGSLSASSGATGSGAQPRTDVKALRELWQAFANNTSGAGSSLRHAQKHSALAMLPPPPAPRAWRGAQVASYGANIMFLLLQPSGSASCPGSGTLHGSAADTGAQSSEHRASDLSAAADFQHMKVAIVLNEQVLGTDHFPESDDGLIALPAMLRYLDTCLASCTDTLACAKQRGG